jgi:hypothetical protein
MCTYQVLALKPCEASRGHGVLETIQIHKQGAKLTQYLPQT